MAFRSQTVGDVVVLKFDMHVYTSILTFDEVKNLVGEYAIPLDLHPCVPPFGLTMNRLLADKILYILSDIKFQFATVMSQRCFVFGALRREKAQALRNRVIRKRAATEGASQHTKKKKKIAPLSFTLSDSEVDGSNRSGSGAHHSASPLNTIIPNEAELTTRGDGLILEPVNQAKKDTDRHLDNMEDTTEVNSLLSEHSPLSQHSNPSKMIHIDDKGGYSEIGVERGAVCLADGGEGRWVGMRWLGAGVWGHRPMNTGFFLWLTGTRLAVPHWIQSASNAGPTLILLLILTYSLGPGTPFTLSLDDIANCDMNLRSLESTLLRDPTIRRHT
ncbi:hypothetical protein Tco_0047488 [Tanacetum coccineum]